MPAGLQVADGSGRIFFDTSTRIVRFIGSLNTGQSDSSISVAQFAEGTGFAMLSIDSSSYYYQYGSNHPTSFALLTYAPKVAISGTTLSWQFFQSGRPDNTKLVVLYGVY